MFEVWPVAVSSPETQALAAYTNPGELDKNNGELTNPSELDKNEGKLTNPSEPPASSSTEDGAMMPTKTASSADERTHGRCRSLTL